MFRAGYIRKIVVKDFVTYSYVEMHPGAHLNLLIGPNGTGKSTIVAAIILGLGGSPKTVGRGTKISEYVKHNCQEATIDIFLQNSQDDNYIHITRNFNLEEKSIWSLNGRKVPYKDIELVTKELNIQVNNLCQFLPQDRVQDFAKMNKQQLLQETQVAICRSDLIEKQLQLIEYRQKHKDYLASVEKNSQKLQELHDANLRIEEKVKNITKKKKYLKVIQDVDRKIAWLKYEGIKQRLDEMKDDRTEAMKILNRHKAAAKPLEVAIENAKKTIENLQVTVADSHRNVKQKEVFVRKKLEVYGGIKLTLNNAAAEMNTRLLQIERRDQEIKDTSHQIAQLSEQKNQLATTHGDDATRVNKTKEYTESLRKLAIQVNKLMEKSGHIDDAKRNKMYEYRAHQSTLEKLENVKQQRLEWLRRMDKDAYSAVHWLRENKNMFKGEVFEPIMLELNVLNPQHAIFIENTIPVRDRIAFVCTLKEDMNTLIQTLRNQQKLNVNIIHSGYDRSQLSAFQPAIPIEQLKRYGLYAYINTLVTGPDPIMKYLCKTYHIHNTPVGNTITNQQFKNVPPQITQFFSDTYRFSTLYSKYTGQKSTRQIEIRSDGSFSISVDAERMEYLRGQIAEVQSSCKSLEEESKGLNIQVNQLNEKQSAIRENIQLLQRFRQDIEALDSRQRLLTNKLQQLQADTTNRSQIEKEYHGKAKKAVAIQLEIKDAFLKYSETHTKFELDRTNLDISKRQVNLLELKSEEVRRLYQEAEETVTRLKTLYTDVMNQARAALANAKQLSNGFTPDDNGFDEFKDVYDKLSTDIQDLQAEKEHLLSKIDCLNTADIGELQEYQDRKELIVKMQTDMAHENKQLDKINAKMDTVYSGWFPPLQQVVEEINDKFSNAFRRMGCAGDVSISKGINEKDFAEYGLSIKVKYRDAEPLQELNNVVQSGGERAVATAAFMLSLQELTPVPFRCVDEINQGMDSNNERRIFELLVDATSQLDTSQYFFITPKLVPNLKFVRNMKIHFVHNGPFIKNQEKWKATLTTAKDAVVGF